MKNKFTAILEAAEAERHKRRLQANAIREELRKARPRITPDENIRLPFEHREYLHRKVRELLT